MNVEGDAQTSTFNGFEKRFAVDEVGARGVDEHRAVRQKVDCAPADDAAGAFDESQVQTQDVTLRGELFDRRRVSDPELRRARRRERSTPGHDPEPEAARPLGHLTTDGSEPRDAKHLAVETLGFAVFLPLP